MYMHEASIHTCLRAGPVELALGKDWQPQESMQGEAMEGAHLSEGIPPTFTISHHRLNPSAPLVNYRAWMEEIRAWVWESQGPAPFLCLRREGYTVQVNVNDYLDIYCPHYNSSGPGGGAEQYVLYMVSRAGYRACNASQGFKRWECNRPHAPHSPIKFSEKFQRYSAFSLGYEFHAGHEYYYISTPTHNLHWKCLRMKVFVCCASKDFEGENPQVPKLEKSISGTSPKREHLPLAVGIAFFLMTLLAS
ncbi:ephrin-A3 isoform X2 [Rhinolophus ferrumequinum]|uniref:ephrin-A3 isoform X2 n=1 Tax=Rhinolophus ferrumequinum TaxID=59479 RepID=UPI00140F989D|nr:ephrin-A3 isoform X2 [Rhinolophus ferrumequinum]